MAQTVISKMPNICESQVGGGGNKPNLTLVCKCEQKLKIMTANVQKANPNSGIEL
jgi:hypothetical protein